MRTLLALLLTCVSVCAQSSSGTVSLDTKIVISSYNADCSMTDIGQHFYNERSSTCAQGQSHFFNGEGRYVDSGEGIYAAATLFNGYELTSCQCSQNAIWTRTMANQTTPATLSAPATTAIRWTWKFYARRADCSLELKRDLSETGCWYIMQNECAEGEIWDLVQGCILAPLESPIVIDLDGDGLRLTNREQGVRFDLGGDGEREQLPWLEEDGWLVIDDRQNGVVLDGRQFFGDKSAQTLLGTEKPNGYAALRVFDDNNVQRIDSYDGVWQLLGIWADTNHDGVSDPGEVRSLHSLGIAALGLDYHESRRLDHHGNEFRYRARVWWANGNHTSSWDVFLTAD